MSKYSPKTQQEVKKTMHEFKKGDLHIGESDEKVTSQKQAVAIGLSKARNKGYKAPKNPND